MRTTRDVEGGEETKRREGEKEKVIEAANMVKVHYMHM
jgi:hypothetical protein